MRHKIPVVIFTGFLGAGKTTIINSLISHKDQSRIAVIENEFGSTSIDTQLLRVANEQIIEITQGCLCCSVRQDFIDILEGFASREQDIDLVIIELSGASEIEPVIDTFMLDEIRSIFKIDSIWGIVDAANIDHEVITSNSLARRQLEVCDVIIVNKPHTKNQQEITDLLRRYNADAYIYETEDGNIDPNLSDAIER